MRQRTHTEDFCPSSASGLGQLCCASQPWVSSPVSQAVEAPKGQQAAGRQVLLPSTTQTTPMHVCLSLCLYVDANFWTTNMATLHAAEFV